MENKFPQCATPWMFFVFNSTEVREKIRNGGARLHYSSRPVCIEKQSNCIGL